MSRTAESVLGIISAIFTVLAIILLSLVVIGGSAAIQDDTISSEIQQEILRDPTLTGQEAEAVAQVFDILPGVFGVFGWGLIIALVISLVLNIIGIVSVRKNKNPKLAGIMFILSGLLAGILSLTSILLYVAAIMCFVRKAPMHLSENVYNTSDKTL